MSYIEGVDAALERIRAQDRYRELPQFGLSGIVDFGSNDYLGLATDPQVVQAFKRATRAGSGGARLLSGRSREHALLETELAEWLGRERALLFTSGYHAALGAIPVLAEFVDEILSDEGNHASLIDGIRLTRTPRKIYPHVQPPTQPRKRTLIVSETLFGMDATILDIAQTLQTLGPTDILLLDEAHALGITGEEGAGLARKFNDPRIVVMGTLSKALGGLGGFIAGPASLIELLVNRARTFIFDTALPPAVALAARIALVIARKGDDRRVRLRENAERLRAGMNLPPGALEGAPVVPIPLHTEQRALEVAAQLLERRLYVPAIRPPTVPPGTSRLRISLRSNHLPEQIDVLVTGLRRCIATS